MSRTKPLLAHDLAKILWDGPNVPVIINGWGPDEGNGIEVSSVREDEDVCDHEQVIILQHGEADE